MSLLFKGNEAFMDGDFDAAIQFYNDAISEDPTLFEAYSARSAALIEVKQYERALQDVLSVLKIDSNYETALFRKGRCYFELKDYKSALDAFRIGKELFSIEPGGKPSNRKYDMWIRKCESELEENGHISVPKPDRFLKPSYQYYQTNEKITISILEKNVKEADATVDLTETRLRITTKKGVLFDQLLFQEVLPTECRFKFLASKIECVLKKKTPFFWASTEKSGKTMAEEAHSQPKVKTESEPKLKTPYASKKNWNELDIEFKKELEKEKPEGEEALNVLFKSIYKDADEDTRRAMIKSFQTSGGTVLSTNWNEVKEKNYEEEKQAPKGMEWRNYEGEKVPQKDSDS